MSRKRAVPPRVSDHAVLRYIERRYNVDVEAERDKIDRLTENAIRVGARLVKVDGVQFVLIGGRVVTVLENGMGSKPRPRIAVEVQA